MPALLYGCQDGMNTIALAVGIPLMNAIAIALRLYTRRRQACSTCKDDWWACAALVVLTAMGVDLLIAAVNQVLSCPQPENAADLLQAAGPLTSRVAWTFNLIAVLGVGMVKMAFLYCMRRVFLSGQAGTLFSKVTYTVMGVVYVWTFGFLVTMVVINVNWGQPDVGNPAKWAGSPATLATDTMFFTMTVSDVIIDGIIMLLPMLVIWQLNLSLERKFAISGIFFLRILALGASVTRMVYTVMFSRWMNELLAVDPNLVDPTHLLTGVNLNKQMIWWIMFEVGFGLFASCITTIQFLLRRQHVEHAIDRIRGMCGLPVTDRRPSVASSSELPSLEQKSNSKQGQLYSEDDRSVLSVEYTVGSIRSEPEEPEQELEPTDADSPRTEATRVGARHAYVRKNSEASLSTMVDDDVNSTNEVEREHARQMV